VLRNTENPRRLNNRGAGLVAAFWLASLSSAAHAQRDDPPLPPRLDAPLPANTQSAVSPRAGADQPRAATPAAPAGGASSSGAGAIEGPGRPPKAARLAPLPESRGEVPDEIIVLGSDDPWRLPDLGSWRAEEEQAERRARVRVTFLHLYDADAPQEPDNPFLIGREAQRFGRLQIFRWRVGRRSKN
jgi:hypothetical protein